MTLIIHVDGGSRGNPGPAGAGVVIESGDGRILFEAGYFLGFQTGNAAEYHALIRALKRVERYPQQPIEVHADSELLVRQITGQYEVRSPKLRQLHERVQLSLLKITSWSIRRVPREENRRADELANLAMDRERDMLFEYGEGGTAGAVPPPDGTVAEGEAAGGGAPAGEAPVGPSAPVPPAGADGVVAGRAVRVITETPADPQVCPAGGCCGDFTLSSRLPGEMCIHAAHALLPTLLALLSMDPREFASVPALTVRCGRPGCGAVFRLTPVSSGNGVH